MVFLTATTLTSRRKFLQTDLNEFLRRLGEYIYIYIESIIEMSGLSLPMHASRDMHHQNFNFMGLDNIYFILF
jgi:hypothetical protein